MDSVSKAFRAAKIKIGLTQKGGLESVAGQVPTLYVYPTLRIKADHSNQ